MVGISIFLTSFVTQPWQLFFLYGILVSLGVGGASNVAATVVVTNWFNEKRGLAFGIMEAGFGAGQMLLVPGSLLLIQWLNWKMTVIILGSFLILIVFPTVLLFLRNYPKEKGLVPIGGEGIEEEIVEEKALNTNFSIWHVFLKREFWFLILPFAICGFTTTGLMDTHLIPFSHDHGFSTSVTSAAVSLLAGFNIIGIMLGETPKKTLTTTKDYLKHAHMGNCLIRDLNHPLYGDKHPRFGYPGSEIDVPELTEYLPYLIGYRIFRRR